MKPRKPSGTFRYAAIGAVLIAAAGVLLGVTQHYRITRDVNIVNQRNNVLLARVFANLVWPDMRDFVRNAHTLPPDTLREHPKIAETHARAAELAKNVPLLKIKVFDLDGLTVFSTDPSQVGEQKSDYPGFVEARKGQVVSVLEPRERFDGLNGRILGRHVLSSYVPITNGNGEIEGVFEIYTDVTDSITTARNSGMLQIAIVSLVLLLLYEIGLNLLRHRDRTIAENHAQQLRLTELAVAAEEANRSKSALLANMSHELRTPLNAVIGFAETMRLQPFGPLGSPKYLTYLEDIWKSGRRLLEIVDNVLEMARIDTGTAKLQFAGVSLSDLVDTVVRQVEGATSGPRAPIRVHHPRIPLLVVVDERRIRHVLTQLVTNARTFTPPHGSIEISMRRNRAGDIEIAVADTGIGMAPEDVESALVPFSKLDKPYEHTSDGARMGLPLARMLMELHGGDLKMESVLGKGTCVTAVLPARCLVEDDTPTLRTSYQV